MMRFQLRSLFALAPLYLVCLCGVSIISTPTGSDKYSHIANRLIRQQKFLQKSVRICDEKGLELTDQTISL